MSARRAVDPKRLPGEITTLVANVVDRDPSDLPFEANLVEELNIDSVMRLEILVVLERTYGVKIDQEDLGRIVSLKDVCELVVERGASAGNATAGP